MKIRALHVVVCSLALVAGCGNDAAEPAATPAKAAPRAMSVETAKAVADAGVLTKADLPGYQAVKDVEDEQDRANEAFLAKCMERTFGPYLAENSGYTFSRSGTEVSSSASVAKSAAQVRAELDAFISHKGQQCLQSLFTTQIEEEGVRAKVDVTADPFSVPGADEATHIVVSFVIEAGGRTVEGAADVFVAVVGPTVIYLDFLVGQAPLSLDDADAFLTSLVARVQAAADAPLSKKA